MAVEEMSCMKRSVTAVIRMSTYLIHLITNSYLQPAEYRRLYGNEGKP